MVLTRRERDEIRQKVQRHQYPPDTVETVVLERFTLMSLLDSADHFEQKCKELQAAVDNAVAVLKLA